MNERSYSEADAADGSVMDGDVEQAVYSRANQSGAPASSPARGRERLERASEESPKDLSGRVLSRLESQFADLFR
jgi:hypothetical protein